MPKKEKKEKKEKPPSKKKQKKPPPPRRKKKEPVKGKAGKCTKKNLVIMYGVLLYFFIMGGFVEMFIGIFYEISLLANSEFVDGKYHVIPLMLITCGLVAVITGFMGIFAATRDNMVLLVAVFRSLICLAIVELACFIVGIIFAFDKSGIYFDKLEKEIKDYDKYYDPVDRMQLNLKCCGYTSVQDYPSGFPFSCCRLDVDVFCSKLHKTRCKDGIVTFILHVGLASGLVCLFMLLVKFGLGAVLWFFAKKVKHDVDYGEDDDPEKIKAREDKKKKKREERLAKRKRKRAKKQKKADLYLAKQVGKKKKAKKDKPKKEKKDKPKKEKKEKPKKEKKEKPKKEKKEKPEKAKKAKKK